MKTWFLIAVLALVSVQTAASADLADAAKSPKGFGSKGYAWDDMTPERIEMMRKTGDPERGREAFRVCRGCHKPDGAGLVDGTYPRLSGQHAVVIIKQVADTRAGIRFNPKMAPFASQHAVSPQEIADIAVFLAAEPSARENGKGPGDYVGRGEFLYQRDGCYKCHGKRGEGDAEELYPVVAAQHYWYLLRELEHIKAGTRGNSHPKMVKLLRRYSRADLEALADYMSRMPDYRLSREDAK